MVGARRASVETRLNEKKPEPLAPQRPQDRASTAVLDAPPAFGADAPPALTFQAIAALQGTAGNAAVAELLGGAAHRERKLPAETDHAHARGPAGAPSVPEHEPAEPVAAEPEADRASEAPPASAGSGGGGAGLSCDQAKDGYAVLLASLLSESANTSCSVGSDCGFIPTSACGNDRSISIVGAAAGAAISSQLDAFATANCESCKFPVLPCGPLPYLPASQCVAGTCKQ